MNEIRNFMFGLALLSGAGSQALATLPPVSPEAKAKAEEAKAKTGWQDKVAAFQLCQSQNRVAAAYRQDQKAAGKPVTAASPQATPCQDPGQYASPLSQKPLEVSGAHSPPGTAATPPSQKATAAETMGTKKPQ